MIGYDELCERATARVVRMLASAPVAGGNFLRPWCRMGVPAVNASTGRRYGGANALLLSLDGQSAASAWWATYRQWGALDRRVRKGQHATHVFKETPSRQRCGDEPAGGPVVYAVFSYAQTAPAVAPAAEPWVPPLPAAQRAPHRRVPELDAWVAALGVSESAAATGPFWDPDSDSVVVPASGGLDVSVDYYGSLLHELVHWSGSAKRIARRSLLQYAADDACRATEELVAEMGAAMSCAAWGVPVTAHQSHAVFRSDWTRVLSADKALLFAAAADASGALRYLESRAVLGFDADIPTSGAPSVSASPLTF